LGQAFLVLQARGFDVVGDEIAFFTGDDERGRALRRSGVDVRSRAAGAQAKLLTRRNRTASALCRSSREWRRGSLIMGQVDRYTGKQGVKETKKLITGH